MESVIQNKKECFLCGKTYDLQSHHVFAGSRRSASERTGMKVWLCADCHTMSPNAVHRNESLNRWLKTEGQKAFEKTHTREEFLRTFGKSYL